jgi:hypothetical protein
MALDAEGQQQLLDQIMAIFTNEANASSFGEDPQGYIDENLPEGTEPADVAACMPEVGESLGGNYSSNLASYNASNAAATNSVVNEIAYTYNTTYQQNTFIYAEEGSQVTNIQGDGNAVSQQQIDVDYGVDEGYGEGEEEPPPNGEAPPEEPAEEPAEAPEPPPDDGDDDGEPTYGGGINTSQAIPDDLPPVEEAPQETPADDGGGGGGGEEDFDPPA